MAKSLVLTLVCAWKRGAPPLPTLPPLSRRARCVPRGKKKSKKDKEEDEEEESKSDDDNDDDDE
jgi:hypothetical protein